jgi:hypothetical protein
MLIGGFCQQSFQIAGSLLKATICGVQSRMSESVSNNGKLKAAINRVNGFLGHSGHGIRDVQSRVSMADWQVSQVDSTVTKRDSE